MKKVSRIMVYVRQIIREGHSVGDILINDGDDSLGATGAVTRSEAEAMHREWGTPIESASWVPCQKWMDENGVAP